MCMSLNKCAYLSNSKIDDLEAKKLNKVKSHKYLGIWLNSKGSIIEHYKKTKSYILS